MSIPVHQYGRRGTSKKSEFNDLALAASSRGYVPLSSRRYVLDILPSEPVSKNRTTTTTTNQQYRQTRTNDGFAHQGKSRSRYTGVTTYSPVPITSVHNETERQLSHPESNKFSYRDGIEAGLSTTRSLDDTWTNQLSQSNADYKTWIVGDENVQASITQMTSANPHYPVNVDSSSELVARPRSYLLPYTQDLAVGYFRPNNHFPTEPINIGKIRTSLQPRTSPAILQLQSGPTSPIITWKKPAEIPMYARTAISPRITSTSSFPPQKMGIKRLADLPSEPPPVVAERRLPSHAYTRQMMHEKIKLLEPTTDNGNAVIKWRLEKAKPIKQIKKLDTQQARYPRYNSRYNVKFNVTESSSENFRKPKTKEELTLLTQKRASMGHQETTMKHDDEYVTQQTLNSREQAYRANTTISSIWRYFSAQEKRNILLYILGIMFYKFGLEAFNGSIITLATNRYDQDAFNSGLPPRTFEKVGLLSGLNQAFQCIGSILIAPLIKRWPTHTVLSVSIFIFAPFTAVLMVVDAVTGGHIKPSNFQPIHSNDFSYYGRYSTNWIIPIYCITGITYGMVEVIRRIIPKDIVGNDVQKLQRMNALVSIFFEIAGTSGTFATALGLIPRFGNNYAFIVTPMFFVVSGISWIFITSSKFNTSNPKDLDNSKNTCSKKNYFTSVLSGFRLFIKTVYVGGKIVFTNRKFVWLWSGYSLALYAHKYLENSIAPQIAKRYLGNADWTEIIVGGSNAGELLGACFVFIFANIIKTPVPWLRLDALILLIVWYVPYFYPPSDNVKYAWIVAATFVPISFAWAAAEVSLGSYIQSSMARLETKYKHISPLGAVMAFLYSSYIIIYAIANPLLGIYLDKTYHSTGSVRPALIYTVGAQTTIISVLVFASTFIPKGAIAFNPILLH